MSQLCPFVELVANTSEGEVDFLVIYIAEAHPTDGWMYPAVESFAYRKQHTRLEERLEAARALRTKLHGLKEGLGNTITILADAMTNTASLAFGALPERLAIILDGEVRFIGGKGPDQYSIGAAADALRSLRKSL